jgi:hypothetical protein
MARYPQINDRAFVVECTCLEHFLPPERSYLGVRDVLLNGIGRRGTWSMNCTEDVVDVVRRWRKGSRRMYLKNRQPYKKYWKEIRQNDAEYG